MKKPASSKIRRVHALLSASGLMDQKASLILQFTNDRETSSKNLRPSESDALITFLEGQAKERRQPMRNKIIHLLCLMGYTKADRPSDADYSRINGFIQNIGAHNPRKKYLNQLTYHQLVHITSQVEAMYKKHIKS